MFLVKLECCILFHSVHFIHVQANMLEMRLHVSTVSTERLNYRFLLLCSFGGSRGGGGYGSSSGGFGGGGSYGSFRGGGGMGGKRDKFGSTQGQSLRKPKWDLNSLPRFEKNFYRESPNVQMKSLVRTLTGYYFPQVLRLLCITK